MADYSSPNRVGRFGFRTPAPITTFVKVDDRRSDKGPDVGRVEISEEHVAMPVSVTDGVVTKIETNVERVYTTSATAYTDGFTTNGSSNLSSNSGSGAWKPIGGTSNTGNDGRNQSSGGDPGAGGGTDTSTSNWSRPIDGSTDNIGPSGRKGLIGGTANGIPTNESRPTDVINSTGTTTQNRPSAGENNSGSGTGIKHTAGTNDTGNDGRSWPSGGGGGGTDAGTNGWNGPIDWIAKDIGPNGMKGLIGGTAYGIPINESRPTRGLIVGANNISARPVVGANNSSTGAWGNPIFGTNNTGNERSGLTGGTNYIGADWTSRPRVMIADDYRLNRRPWGQPPTNDISTRPTNYPGVAAETKEPSKAPHWRGQFLPSSVTPTAEPKTIDSNEAARKYKGIGFTAPPQRKKFIDSYEAAEKYKGVFINGKK